MKDTDKVTLTVSQLKKLVSEAKVAKKKKVNEDDDDWQEANRKLKPVKKEIAQKGRELYDQLFYKFIATMSKDFIKYNISYHSDRPQDAAREFFYALVNDENMSVLTSEMYLFDGE